MSTTAGDLVRGALRLIGCIASGEAVEASEASEGLEALNEMLSSWRGESLFAYQRLEETFTLTPGVANYTIGPSGTFNTTRPDDVLSAFVRDGDLDYPLGRYDTRDEYDQIGLKTIQGIPESFFYDSAVPLGTLLLYYVPDKAYGIKISSYKQLQSFSGLTTAIVLPPGYNRAIRFNLALELAPEYERTPSPWVVKTAQEAKASVKSQNLRIGCLSTERLPFFGDGLGHARADFLAGY